MIRVWDARSYMFHEARSKVDDVGKRQYLGKLWLIFNPIIDGFLYYLIFGIVLQVEKDVDNFIAFLLIGVFFFQLTAKSVNSAAGTLLNRKKASSGAPLPVLTIPLSAVVRTWLTGLPSYVVMMVMILLISPPDRISSVALLVFPVIVLQVMITAGVAILGAHFVGIIPDLQNLLRAATRAWMFGSCVMFTADRFSKLGPAVDFLIHWNPLYWVLEYSRLVLIYDTAPVGEGWFIMGLWALLPLLLGCCLVWLRGDNYGTAR
ncbi:hypothetical protein BJH93_09015 [Kocuria polaris]|nr:hypothetical protein [Kocuria polaris]